MYKAYLSYRFTGENLTKIEPILKNILDSINLPNDEIFCSLRYEDFFQKNKFSSDEIYQFCRDKIKETDTFIAFIKSNKKSKGMQIELEKAFNLNKKIILLIKDNLKFPEFEKKAHKIIHFKDFRDLNQKLKEDNFVIH